MLGMSISCVALRSQAMLIPSISYVSCWSQVMLMFCRPPNCLQGAVQTGILRFLSEEKTIAAAEGIDVSKTPLAFMSYVNDDDKYANGKITQFREHLSRAMKAHSGKPFGIFQDKEDIKWGQQWQERINDALDATLFLIPIITPSFFNSSACRDELERFLKREEKLGRGDLILPVYYFDCPVLNDKEKLKQDTLAEIIAARQREDWRELRHHSFKTRKLSKALEKMARLIMEALEQSQSEFSSINVVQPTGTPHPQKAEKYIKEPASTSNTFQSHSGAQRSTQELLMMLAGIKSHLSALPEKAQENLRNAVEDAEQEALKCHTDKTRENLKYMQNALKDIQSNMTAIHVGELLAKALIWCGRTGLL